MKISKSVLLSIVLAAMLMASMLFIGTGNVSNTKLASAGEYDPWKDINDDGYIEMMDFFELSQIYMTSGTPINKTELLLELQARIDSLNATNLELQTRVDLLNASLLESQSRIDDLNASLTSQINVLMTQMVTMNATIVDLGSRIATLESPGFMKAPAYDSGWLDISQGQTMTLTHNLNTDPAKLFFYVLGKSNSFQIHQMYYGGENTASNGHDGLLACFLTSTQIDLCRWPDDPYWEQVRVQIWIIQ
jgi:hypothetical protein